MAIEHNFGYKIWAVDNVVYGPVELPVLIGWVQEERVTTDTWIYHEQNDAWRKAGQLPELQRFFTVPNGVPYRSETTVLRREEAGLRPGMLRRIKAFASMEEDQLIRFLDFMEIQKVRQFTEIVKQGHPGDAMYFVLEGEARVRMLIAGREMILTILTAGDFFGEISLFDHGPRSADVVANQDSVLLKVSAAAFQRLASEAPELASPFLLAMGRTLTGRIRADNKRFRDSVNLARVARGQ